MFDVLLNNWSFWITLAVVLAIIEVFTMGYLAIGFSAAALVVAVLSLGPLLGAWAVPAWLGIGVLIWFRLARLNFRKRGAGKDVNDFDPMESLSPREKDPSAKWSSPSESYDTDTKLHEQKKPAEDTR